MLRIQKKLLTLSLLFSIFVPVFAHGKSDIEDVEVSNLNSWQEQIDLESKKAGKYNIMITAKDLGGNVMLKDRIISGLIRIPIYLFVALQTHIQKCVL